MLQVNDLIAQIRIDEKDIDETVYSDWDILNAMNKALRYLANYFSTRNTDFFDKYISYTQAQTANGADLPDDYIVIRKVINGDNYSMSPSTEGIADNKYFVSDNKIYATSGITMYYKGMVSKAVKDGQIELPMTFFDVTAMLSRLILTNVDKDILSDYIRNVANELVPRRKYSNVKISMDFRV